jgi:phosphoribosylamine--glycine ligase
MGAYSADNIVTDQLSRIILESVVAPTLKGLAADGTEYRGFLYFGLMLTDSGPKVLEFNCRLGDPETQAIMARVDFDLAKAFEAAANGKLDQITARWTPGASVCVVMTSGGYPGKHEVNKEIVGLPEAAGISGAAVFHAGTKAGGGEYYTSSGRVLGVTGAGADLEDARRTAYAAVRKIHFDGAHYRTDIGGPKITSTTAAGD